jgi:hypothetical protein
MKIATSVLVLLLLAVCAGCGGGDAGSAPEAADDALPEIVQEAVDVARELDADPDDAEAVLERHGLDVESFEAMMYEISSDPTLAQAYTAQLGG